MKILKYKKGNKNEYIITTDDKEYKLYDDLIIKYELLQKKEISNKEMDKILKEQEVLKAYFVGLKAISIKLRTTKELKLLLKKKGFHEEEITYALTRLEKEGYFNHTLYISSYIHDTLLLKVEGEEKIRNDLEKLGFRKEEIDNELSKIDSNIYQEKIKKYIDKKLKANKKSAQEFKRKQLIDLLHKGFLKQDIEEYLNQLNITDNEEEIKRIISRLYSKYIKKFDRTTTIMKIRNYLYTKGYNVNIEEYLKKDFY